MVLAVPIGPKDITASFAGYADEVVCLRTPSFFAAVGQGYRDFRQTSDDEVIELLDRARNNFAESAGSEPAIDPPLRDEEVRVLAGPRLSPLGLLVTRVIRPRLAVDPRLVPGPPKRFAQGIGAAFSLTALVLGPVLGAWEAARVVLVLLIGAASLEAFVGLCLGCKAFALLMRAGIIPEAVCERCNDIWAPATR